jgi:hypothetical protein
MKPPVKRLCSECLKLRERCRAVGLLSDGSIEYVCRQCWRDLCYDDYMYKHLEKENSCN